MSDWKPTLYREFEDERTRPARELLARVPLASVRHAVDLGCGPGNSTELLVERFPTAAVIGTDSSTAMLASARERLPEGPRLRFTLGDIATWTPGDDAPGLIFANASLQWVTDHRTLIPRLFGSLAPGGVLAVQMPDNLDEPSHRLMREVAALPDFSREIGNAAAVRSRLLDAESYYDLLATEAAHIDIWHTVYRHPMASPGAIVKWLRSTGLRPFLDRLDTPTQAAFLADYEARIDDAYPPRIDGRRLLRFPRLFIVAERKP